MRNAFTPLVLKASFKRTGIYPWNPQIIEDHLERKMIKLNNKDQEQSLELVKAVIHNAQLSTSKRKKRKNNWYC